jgi:DNA repair exonuclease SbcCD ATPase subunit
MHVGSDLRIHVEPGGKNLGEIWSEAEQAEVAYQDALADLGVDTVDAARSRVQEKERIDDRLETIASEIDRLVPEVSGDLDDARARAEARLEAARSERAKRPAGQDVASLPDEEDAAREQVSQAREDLEAAQEALSEAREELQSHEDTAQDLREAVQRLRRSRWGTCRTTSTGTSASTAQARSTRRRGRSWRTRRPTWTVFRSRPTRRSSSTKP